MTLRRTTDRLPHTRYGRGRLEFDAGEREVSVDEETEEWAVETFTEIERVSEDDGDAEAADSEGDDSDDFEYEASEDDDSEDGDEALEE